MKKQDQSYSDPKAANGKIALKDKLLHEPQRASRKEPKGRALPDITSGPEVQQIFKIRTVRKPDF